MNGDQHKKRLTLLLVLMAVSTALSLAGAFILTDGGQIFGISKAVVIGYFRVHGLVMGAAAGLTIEELFHPSTLEFAE